MLVKIVLFVCQIPTLEEALVLLMELDLRVFIDVKNPHPLVTPTLLKIFAKHPALYAKAAVCSFFPLVVYDIRRASEGRILTGQLVDSWIQFMQHRHNLL